MKITRLDLDGLLIVEPSVFEDSRGFFLEAWHHDRYAEMGIVGPFVQDNVSCSKRGVLRGLHFQNPGQQGKLVSVLRGDVFDVAVDIRLGSRTFKQWVGVNLSQDNHRVLYIPPGFAHGFLVLSDEAIFLYKCTEYYRREFEHSLRWNDPDLAIAWPDLAATMSEKDASAPLLKDLPPHALPHL